MNFRAAARRPSSRRACHPTFRLVAVGVVLATWWPVLAPHVDAATLYWDQDGAATTATGGTGTWTLNAGSQWHNGSATGSLQTWTDSTGTADIADFAGTAGTVTLGSNVGALGLVIETAGYTFNTDAYALTLGARGITVALSSGTTSINNAGGLILAAAQSWTVNSGHSLLVTAPVANGGFQLTLAAAGGVNFSNTISGTGGLAKTGTGTVAISSPSTYSGATTVGTANSTAKGGTLQLLGTGSLASSSIAVSGVGSQLQLYNASTTSAVDRIGNSATVTLNLGGEFYFNGSNTASTPLSETIGTLAYGTGATILTLNSGTSSTSPAGVTAGGFARGSNFATGLVRGTNLGLNSSANGAKVLLTSTAGLTQVGTSTSTGGTEGTTKNLTVVPYLLGATSAASTGTNFVTYDTTSGLRRLGTDEQSAVATAADGDNVRATAAANTLTGARVFNSLLFNGTGTAATPGSTGAAITGDGNTLTLTSGALANVAITTTGSASLNGFSAIVFGTTGANEAVVTNTNANAALTIGSPVNTFAAGGGLTTAGAGTVILGADNLYTGQTTVNAGTLQIGAGTAGSLAAGSGNIVLNGGNLRFNRTDTGLVVANNISGLGNVTQAGTGTTTLAGTSTHTGTTAVSAGTLVLNGAATATSAVTIGNTGTLQLGANDRINDAAPVTLSGGTLNTGGFQEGRSTGLATATAGLGALTMSASSTLDFGSGHTGSSVLAFSDSHAQAWSGTLTLLNFAAGVDELNFANAAGLTGTQLAEISYIFGGTTFTGSSLDSFGNVLFSAVPVPEPATWAAGVLMLAVAARSFRRRVGRIASAS